MKEKQPANDNHAKEDQLEIISYLDELRHHFKALNYEWLERYFRVEEGDKIALSNPREQILDKGGFIFFAKNGDSVVGTAALIRKNDAVIELGKMVVTPSARGSGVGTRLLDHCIRFARQRAVEKLILYSNTRLEAAIYLYKKFGFRQIALEKGLYERANIKMELDLV